MARPAIRAATASTMAYGTWRRRDLPHEWLPKILGWNKSDPPARFDAAIAAERLFESEPVP
jgi:hypothetical protein